MSISLSLDELRAYNEWERAKWDVWFRAQSALVFPAVWDLLDHIFVVERRHLQRLRAEYPLPETTGVAPGDWASLWEYGLTTRAQLIAVTGALPDADANTSRTVLVMGQNRQITPRKILFHIFVHEIRHWAQVSLAVRNAGFTPPGEQDLIFSPALG